MRLREKAAWAITCALGIFIVLAVADVARGGPIDPPGPLAPTMKTLDQVEPRIPIGQPASFPININQSGSYYLTGDITGVSGKDGIVINDLDVTIDLNGFRLSGVSGSGNGIATSVGGAGGATTVRHGTIRAWGGAGIKIPCGPASFEDLIIQNNDVGIDMSNPGCFTSTAVIENNTIEYNHNGGIRVQNDTTIRNNRLLGNFYAGIVASGDRNRIDGNDVKATSNVAPNKGIWVSGGTGSVVTDNISSSNTGDGITINGTGTYVARNTVNGNGASGIFTDTSSSRLRIEDNHATGNNWGFYLDGAGKSTVIRNSATGNTAAPYVNSVSGNDMAPWVSATAATNPFSNIVY